MDFVQNILWNSIEGFVEAGTRTAGGYAGDALVKAGDLIESSGRDVGDRIERTASGYGTKISGQTYQPAAKALPSTARKPVIKRSNSSPAAMSTKSVRLSSKTPIGAKKYSSGTATKQITSGAGGGQKANGGVVGGAQRSIGGVAGGAQNTLEGWPGGAQKRPGGIAGGAQKATGGAPTTAKKEVPKPYGISTTPSSATSKPKPPTNTPSLSTAKGAAESKANPNNLPKPYAPSLRPTEKKTAVKPGQPKPFNLPGKGAGKEATGDKEKMPYPGANSYLGQGSQTPVRPQKYKPHPRMQGTAEKGKVQHIAIG